MAADQPSAPVLTVVRGYPSPEELAAVVAVVAAAGPVASQSVNTGKRDSWADPSRSMRRHFQPQAGHLHDDSWWLSGLPQ